MNLNTLTIAFFAKENILKMFIIFHLTNPVEEQRCWSWFQNLCQKITTNDNYSPLTGLQRPRSKERSFYSDQNINSDHWSDSQALLLSTLFFLPSFSVLNGKNSNKTARWNRYIQRRDEPWCLACSFDIKSFLFWSGRKKKSSRKAYSLELLYNRRRNWHVIRSLWRKKKRR